MVKLVIEDLTDETDARQVAYLFAETFRQREPTCIHLQQPAEQILAYGIPTALQCIQYGLSFICKDLDLPADQNVVGYRLCKPMSSSEIKDYKPDANIKNYVIASLLNHLQTSWYKKKLDLLYDECKLLELKIMYNVVLGTKEGYEGMGIATKLSAMSINRALELNYDLVLVIATAAATQKIFEKKFNFVPVYEIKYDDYTQADGAKPFFGIKQPKSVIVYEKSLSDWQKFDVQEYNGKPRD